MKKRMHTFTRLVILLAIFAFILYHFVALNQNRKLNKNLEDNEKELQINLDVQKNLLKKNLESQKRFIESINQNTEIVLLKETGNIQIFHDKTANENKYLKWLNYSNITLKLFYTASISIDTSKLNIEMDYKTGDLRINYPENEIKISSISIDNILTSCQKGLISKHYSPDEIVALTLIAKDKVEYDISCDESLIFLAKYNLDSFLKNTAYKHGIFNIIIENK